MGGLSAYRTPRAKPSQSGSQTHRIQERVQGRWQKLADFYSYEEAMAHAATLRRGYWRMQSLNAQQELPLPEGHTGLTDNLVAEWPEPRLPKWRGDPDDF